MSEPSIDEVVQRVEARAMEYSIAASFVTKDILRLIASWRKRGEALKRLELCEDELSASPYAEWAHKCIDAALKDKPSP